MNEIENEKEVNNRGLDFQEEMEKVRVPASLTDRQVKLAKKFVYERQEKGITVRQFCNDNISSKSWYDWKEIPAFDQYLSDLSGSLITDDVVEAYGKVKKRILHLATKDTASIKELELFNDHFSGVIEYEKLKELERLGISDKRVDTKTTEEKRNSLIHRLKS